MRVIVPIVVLLGGCDLIFQLHHPNSAPGSTACLTPARAFADPLTGSLQPQWDEQAGAQAITVDSGGVNVFMDQVGEASLVSTAFYDLRESSFSLTIDDNSLSLSDFVAFALEGIGFDGLGAGKRVSLIRQGDAGGIDKLVVDYTVDTQTFRPLTIDYDPIAHHVWQIGRTGDSIVWSVSPDGVDFTPLLDFELDLAFAKPVIVVQRSTTSVDEFTTTLRNLNGGTATADVCPAERLIDAFDGTGIDLVTWGQGVRIACTLDVGGDRLHVNATPGVPSNCSLGSSGVYNLLDSSFVVEVKADLFDHEGVYLDVVALDGSLATIVIIDQQLGAQTVMPGGMETPVAGVAYDREAHRFWRVSGSNSPTEQVTWEVSADGIEFEFFGKSGDFKGLDRVRFEIGTFNTFTANSRVSFGGVNVAP